MAADSQLRYCYIVEGASDEDRLHKLGAQLVIKTGGKFIRPATLKMTQAISRVRRLCIATDPDNPGQRIRERIVDLCGSDRCSSIRTHFSDSFDGKKVGIAETPLETLRAVLEPYLRHDAECGETDSISQTEMLLLGLSGPGASARRAKIEAKLGFTTPDAPSLNLALRCLKITPQQIEEMLKDD